MTTGRRRWRRRIWSRVLPKGRPEKILFLHLGGEMYGADRILLEMLAGIDRSRFDPVVIVPETGDLLPHLERLGVTVYVRRIGVLKPHHFSRIGRARLLLEIARAVAGIVALSRRYDFILVHSNTSFVLSGGIVARVLGVPHVWHIHEIITRPRMWLILSWLIPRLADVVVTVSHAVRDHLVSGDERNEAKAVVIHNGISAGPFLTADPRRVRREYGIGDREVLIGMVARVNYWKGQETFLEIAGRLAKGADQVRFLMVGGTHAGEEERLASLIRRVGEAGLDRIVHVSDYRHDIPDVLAALDVVVVPSTQPDPFPTVALEAMCSAKPVVAFEFGGMPEMITDGVTGILVPPVDVRGMAGEIRRLIRDPDRRARLGSGGQVACRERFRRETFVAEIKTLYAGLVESRPVVDDAAGATSGRARIRSGRRPGPLADRAGRAAIRR